MVLIVFMCVVFFLKCTNCFLQFFYHVCLEVRQASSFMSYSLTSWILGSHFRGIWEFKTRKTQILIFFFTGLIFLLPDKMLLLAFPTEEIYKRNRNVNSHFQRCKSKKSRKSYINNEIKDWPFTKVHLPPECFHDSVGNQTDN